MQDALEICPLRMVMDIIGGKWKMPIICVLAVNGTVRYGQIKRKIPTITNMMLSQSLKDLEEHGLIHREQYNEVPPRVEYSLTELGKSLPPALASLNKWGKDYISSNTEYISHCSSCLAVDENRRTG